MNKQFFYRSTEQCLAEWQCEIQTSIPPQKNECEKLQLTWSSGVSTTSRSFSICSLQPPTSLYVTSGFSSTCIIVTVGSIFGGKGM